MRIIVTVTLLFSVITVKSQTASLVSPVYFQIQPFGNNINTHNSTGSPRLFFSTYSCMAASFPFVRGAEASIVATNMMLQLNRRLNKNFYAYANVAITPAYISMNPSLISSGFNNNFKYISPGFNDFSIYPSASFGVMYVNDAKTFSISCGISAEKNGHLIPPYSTPEHVSKPGL